MLIHNCLQAIGEAQSVKLCLIHGEQRLTYQELSHQTALLARHLASQIQKGDRVLVKLAEPMAQLIYFFAVIQAGGACIFVDASVSDEVCQQLIAEQNVTLCIDQNFEPSAAQAPLPEVGLDDLFLGALSSGSTGIPKVIWRDHQSWTSAFPVQSRVFNLCREDTLFLAGSLAYSANLNACLHMLAEGGTIVFAASYLARSWLKQITANGVTAIFMVPANYRTLIKMLTAPLEQIKSVVTGGAKMDGYTVRKLMQFFPKTSIYEYYGASELGHVSYSTGEDLLQHPGSVGKVFPGVTIQVDEQIIWVESPYLAPQFRPKATVGDLGKVDEQGYVYLLGRQHGIINSGGVKVIPEQVEEILLTCPGVAEAVVGGIDDPVRGQKVCAWIVKSDMSLSTAAIAAYCRKKMLNHCVPQRIVFIDQMPLNSSGKIDRRNLIYSVS